MQVKNELTEFVDRLDNGRMKKVFSLPYFNKVHTRYCTNKKDIDFQELIDVYKGIGITKNDLITLTKLSDFINHNNKLYRPINKENNFGISLRFNSTYEKKESKGINNYLAIESNYIDIEKIIEQELKQYMNIEKIGEREYFISEIQKVHNFKIESQEISNYIRKNDELIIIRGQEEDLDKFVDIIYVIPDNFSEISEKFLLMDGLSLVMSVIPPEMKNIKIKYIIDDNNIIGYLKSLGINKVGQLKKIDYIKIEINILRFISETVLNTNFKCPKSYQDEIGQSLQQSLSEKYYEIAKLIYLNNMKYTEVAVKFGITRSGAQIAGEKIKKKLFNIDNSIFNDFFKQTMLFRDNDYYFSQELFEKVNVSENLFCSIFGMIKYKDSNLYVLDNIVNQISTSNEQRVYLFDEKNYKEEPFEFDFIKSLPNIIKKCDIGKTI